jgi:Helix-turn-helix domain
VLESSAISPGAKLAYAMLLKYAWQNDFCFPGQDRLAKDMGVSLRSTNPYIQEPERKSFTNITQRGQGRPNLYEVDLTPRSKKKEHGSRRGAG